MTGVERRAAPRTSFQQQLVACLGLAAPDLLHELSGLMEGIGADVAADPDADVDGCLAEPYGIPPADQLEGTDHARRAVELLPGEQAQGVAHERRGSTPGAGVLQAPPDDEERDKTKIRFGLAAAGRKPDEVQHVPVVVVFPNCGLHDREQKGQLEGTPPVAAGSGLLAGNPIGLAHLVEHRPVREPERLGRERVGAKHLDACAHARKSKVHPSADSIRGSLLRGRPQRCGDVPLLHDPIGVTFGEAGKIVRRVGTGEAGEVENHILLTGIDGHHRHLGLGHEVGPDPRRSARPYLPVRGRAVADRVDALLPVLELELLFFFGQQARVDARILDKLTALDHAFDPRLEQRLANPVPGPSVRRRVRVELSPVAQGHGEDDAVAMRPRANVDSRAPLPDRLGRFAARRGTRPRDGMLGKGGPDVLANQEPPPLAPLLIASVDGRGSRDREAHIAANTTGEADRRWRHVPPPARRSRMRFIVRLAARGRRFFRVVEEGRLGLFVYCRGGVDTGQAGVYGVKHPRRISIQRRYPQAALSGRSDELSAQPGDELLSGFDVHQIPLPAEDGAARQFEISKFRHINMILHKEITDLIPTTKLARGGENEVLDARRREGGIDEPVDQDASLRLSFRKAARPPRRSGRSPFP